MLRLVQVIVMSARCDVCGGASDEGLHNFALRRDQFVPCPICNCEMHTICTTAEARRLIFRCPKGHHHHGPLSAREDAPRVSA